MRGIKISWLIGAIAVAVLIISLIQVKWLKTSLDLQKKIFDQSVEQLLNTVSHWILVEADFASLEIDHETEDLGDPLIADGLQRQSRAILLRMETIPMDSLLSLSLREHGIETSVVFGAFDRYGQPAYLDERSEVYREELLEKGYSVGLGPLQLRVYFPDLGRHLVKSIVEAFMLSGVMLLFIAIGLAYVMRSVIKSKELVRIRRELMNNLTHELKTPISTIGLASEALGDSDLQLNEVQKNYYISMIRGENKRLGVLVEKVLQASLSDSKSLKLYPVEINIHDVIKDVVRNVAMQVRKQGGKVELSLKAPNPIIYADKIHITNVIFNLLDNAIKYSPNGAQIKIISDQTEDGVELLVKDNGVGIPKEYIGKVFERLFRVPTGNVHDVKGFGLGLSYVKTVIERHGGHIYVESEADKGSTFVLKLKFDSNLK
ncbi:MAG: HAMP domain-containing sensor histidine kinase [Bacteroidetes bacterium]|jgi:two-component system, OmpR family, phosphate regulon sensor histidine kinase PhoR|nr:HAMP domain-containing sensor histidine kinase [Bacteroidota bacterium]MDA0980321.1 HAMP domain-containing sensor histidine kinase [Bacteroidota bacterium]